MQTCLGCGTSNEDDAEVCFRCRTVLSAITQGTVIASRYEIVERIGKGGMGVVYKALDRTLDEIVALKVLRVDVGELPTLARRFRSEIKLARRVTHPNVCRIHDYGEEGRLRYISMELVEGTDLKKVIRQRGRLPLAETYDVGIQIADGLAAIHQAGIVHRDLKSPNIMTDVAGVVRLMDFGIAKMYGSQTATGATATGQIIGSPDYMSPEQARGDAADARSDIYALGVVLFEMATGELPFRSDTPVGLLLQHLDEPPPLDGPLVGGVPDELLAILRKALAKRPDDRFGTASEVSHALRSARTATPTGVRPRVTLAGTAEAAHASQILAATEPTPRTVLMPTPVPTAVPAEVRTQAAVARQGGGVAHADIMDPPPPQHAMEAIRSAMPRESASRQRASPFAVRTAVLIPAVLALAGSVGLVALRPSHESAPLAPVPDPAAPLATAHPRTGVSVTAPPPTALRAFVEPIPSPRPLRSPPARPLSRRTPSAPSPAALLTADAPSTAPPLPAEAPPPVAVADPPVAVPMADAPATLAKGLLQLAIRPYAHVVLDGEAIGSTPLGPLELSAGRHVVQLTHPDYHPLQRKLTIRGGETFKLTVDFTLDGIRK